jgi:phosphoribosylaminoimidazole-succinocarboxamide synthase
MTGASTVTETNFENLPLLYRGKVRDVYQPAADRLLLVATDRLSAFDCILPTPIHFKGSVLTSMSAFWFRKLAYIVGNHLITTRFDEMPDAVQSHSELRRRSMLVKKTTVFPVECVVRGYLEGSGWKDYEATGAICEHRLPAGLRQCERLPEPLFTPATKAETGHDENISEERFAEIVGEKNGTYLKTTALELYREASEYALTRGIIIADTKFEFGIDENGEIILIDEVLTPDSSRFWDAAAYEPGRPQASFDKQFVREYLESLDWDKRPPAPPLPPEIAAATTDRYLKAHLLITGHELSGIKN